MQDFDTPNCIALLRLLRGQFTAIEEPKLQDYEAGTKADSY
jgi:hypothetical protein